MGELICFHLVRKIIGHLLFYDALDFAHPDIKYRVQYIRPALFVTNAYRTQFVEIREDCGKNEPMYRNVSKHDGR